MIVFNHSRNLSLIVGIIFVYVYSSKSWAMFYCVSQFIIERAITIGYNRHVATFVGSLTTYFFIVFCKASIVTY